MILSKDIKMLTDYMCEVLNCSHDELIRALLYIAARDANKIAQLDNRITTIADKILAVFEE